MITSLITMCVMISASIHILAEYHGQRRLVYLFKPLTMLFIILIAVLGQTASPLYKTMIIAGLIFSTAGDVLLMLPADRFAAGLAAFLAAHLFYIAAFLADIEILAWWPVIPLVIYGLFFYFILSRSLGKLRLPVLTYIVVILMMVWLAWERWSQIRNSSALLACIGAVLFLISDTLLAIDHFRGAFKSAQVLKLSTYYSAQWLIANSIGIAAFCEGRKLLIQ